MPLSNGWDHRGGLKVAVIDASPLFRFGVAQALLKHDPLARIVEGGSAKEAWEIVETLRVDIMLVDTALAPTDALFVATLCSRNRAPAVVVLAASEHEEDISMALRHGARGYVLKRAPIRELLDAVTTVQSGSRYLSTALGAKVVFNLAKPASPQNTNPTASGLTLRELQIIKQVSVGATNKEIAKALGIREKTVKYHMTNVMAKLQVRNRVEAVLAAGQLLRYSA